MKYDKMSKKLDDLRDTLYRLDHLKDPDPKIRQQLQEAIHATEQAKAAKQKQGSEAVQAQHRQNQGAQRNADARRIPPLI